MGPASRGSVPGRQPRRRETSGTVWVPERGSLLSGDHRQAVASRAASRHDGATCVVRVWIRVVHGCRGSVSCPSWSDQTFPSVGGGADARDSVGPLLGCLWSGDFGRVWPRPQEQPGSDGRGRRRVAYVPQGDTALAGQLTVGTGGRGSFEVPCGNGQTAEKPSLTTTIVAGASWTVRARSQHILECSGSRAPSHQFVRRAGKGPTQRRGGMSYAGAHAQACHAHSSDSMTRGTASGEAPGGLGGGTEAATDDVAVYERNRGWTGLDLRELWRYRELLYFLTWRDILVRYKQAVHWRRLGGPSAAAHDGRLHRCVQQVLGVKSPSSDIPYAVFSFSGLLPWNFFAGAMSRSGVSLVGNANLLTEGLLPAAGHPDLSGARRTCGPGHLLRGPPRLMAAYGIAPTWHVVFLPLFVLLAFVDVARRQPVAQRTQRPLPRRAVRHPVPRAAVDVCEPGHLPDRLSRRPAARRLRAQPHDGSHRRLPVGAAGTAIPDGLSVVSLVVVGCSLSAACSTSSGWNACLPMWCRR